MGGKDMGRMNELALIGETYGVDLTASDAVRRCLMAARADIVAHFFAGAADARQEQVECSSCAGSGAARHSPNDCLACGGTGIEGACEPDPDAAYELMRERRLGW